MRTARLLVLGALAACSGREAEPPPPSPPRQMPVAPPADAAPDAYVVPDPTFRLPATTKPLAYDLRLEIDPSQERFTGAVEIRVQLAAATRTIWLHANELEITGATYREGTRDGVIVGNRVGWRDLRSLTLDREVGPGEIVMKLVYAGPINTDFQGLFRERADGKWAVFSQAQAAHARRIVPCFDEPRFKVPWRVTLTVPGDQVALANAPVELETKLPDGRREVRFAPTDAIPSYLLAVAVGPFTIVNGGTVGRAKLPFRVIAWRSARTETAFALTTTPKIVNALEAYFDQPLPLAKLDFLAVPSLFGAMEHPGLVTFESSIILGDPRASEYRRRFIRVAAHELVHQWMGNLVTPAWWDDLWLSEAFATFVGDKISMGLDGFDDFALRAQLDREHALAADAEAQPHAIRHPIAEDDDLDETFDAIAYEKGAAVLAMFEQHVGAELFRSALRAYVTKYAGGTAVTADLVAEVARVSTPAVGAALAGHLERTGTPVVELALRCTGSAPVLAARARDGVAVPVCIRYPVGAEVRRHCALVGDRTEMPLAACPAWLIGNDDGRGYYQIAWAGTPPMPALALATPAERLAYGDDLAGAVMRGELAVPAALGHMQQLAASKDPYAALSAVSIGMAIDPLIPDAARPRWVKFVAAQLADRLTANALFQPKRPVEHALRDAVLGLVPPEALAPAIVKRARAAVDRMLVAKSGDLGTLELLLAIAAPSGGTALFDRVVARAKVEKDDAVVDGLHEVLGSFGADLAPRVVDLALEVQRPGGPVAALTAMLSRPSTRAAAWAAVHAKIGPLVMRLAPLQSKRLVDAFGQLCDPAARTAIAAELPASAAAITDGRAAIDRALAEIDRCIARRAAAGDVAAALPP
jgi:aminopeptidase N